MQHFSAQVCPTPGGLMLADTVIAKRKANGRFDVDGREAEIHALLTAAYEKSVSPRAIGYIKSAAEILAKVSDEELESAAYPYFPNPRAKPTTGDDYSLLTKALVMLALTGLNSVHDVKIAKEKCQKAQRDLRNGTSARTLLEKLQLVPDDIDLLTKYRPDQARVPAGNPYGGQWEDDPGSGMRTVTQATYEEAAYVGVSHDPMTHGDYVKRKQDFVDANLGAADKAAAKMNVPVENILGISALESKWGKSRFAQEGNNFFGLHYPAPFMSGAPMVAARSGAKVARFANYEDSLRSFLQSNSNLIRGKSNPVDFMTSLQNSGKFGINTDTGEKMPNYVRDGAATIRGLRSLVIHTRAKSKK